MKSCISPTLYGMIATIIVGLFSFPASGQVKAKKQLTEADYHLWLRMVSEQLSVNGNWVSYRFLYPNTSDTTFVVNTKTLEKIAFPNSTRCEFNGEESFAVLKKEGLFVYNLISKNEAFYPEVVQFEFSANGKYLVTLENKTTLVVRINNIVTEKTENVTSYEWNLDKNKLFYTTQLNESGTVGVLNLINTVVKQLIISSSAQRFNTLKWQENGNSVAFYTTGEGNKSVYYYDFISSKLFTLKSSDINFPTHMKVATDQNIPLKVSRDGRKVFFGITNRIAKDISAYSTDIEIWNTQDLILYPERKLNASVCDPEFLAVWIPEENLVRQLSSEMFSWVALNGNQNYALIGNKLQYEPQYEMYAPMDYYLLNVITGTKELILKLQSGFENQLSFSPDGNYISFYKNSDWWVYDIAKKTHINLTKNLDTNWDNHISDPGTELRVWEQTDWTKDGKFILCYDYNDIWSISIDGKNHRRLTDGKGKGFRYRFDKTSVCNIVENNYLDSGTAVYDLSKDNVLSSHKISTGAKGFSLLKANTILQTLILEEALISNYTKAKDGNSFLYLKQKFDLPPTIVLANKKLQKVIVQSNEQHLKYSWGRSQMIHYTDSKGTLLNGALFYPANFDGSTKVPLIVYIYEIVSGDIHNYVNPSNYNMEGFNITNFTSNGYAVLLADISYEKGNPGISASDCVNSAVDKVVEMGVADPRKIALFGHSFGGYETNFILTQSRLFTTAISGAGISDIIGHYFNYNYEAGSVNSWRYENQQLRMAVPFFDDQEAYYKNSPLPNSSKINCPLLLWSGKLDKNVPPEQSEILYSALRRLKKESVMVVYPDDGHVLFNLKNQEDLTMKVKDWFGHYLKGEPKKGWMKADFEKN